MTTTTETIEQDTGDFNSHAHVERDAMIAITYQFQMISTHTLTWSVTAYEYTLPQAIKISTHTLTWSVTSAIYVWPPIH